MQHSRIQIVTDPIAVTATSAGQEVTINHGFGRPVAGWLVVDRDTDITFHRASDDYASRSSDSEVVLIADKPGNARLVMLA